jgi:hypothetical protein
MVRDTQKQQPNLLEVVLVFLVGMPFTFLFATTMASIFFGDYNLDEVRSPYIQTGIFTYGAIGLAMVVYTFIIDMLRRRAPSGVFAQGTLLNNRYITECFMAFAFLSCLVRGFIVGYRRICGFSR